jgi:hypothetical protein
MIFKIIILFLALLNPLEAYCQEGSDLSIFDKNKVFSIISVNYFYKNQPLFKNSKIKCEIEFYDDYKQKVISKIDENSNYIILASNTGKVFLENIKCSRHSIPLIYGASRFKTFDNMGFIAHQGFVNYVGELNIYYNPALFKFLDIFNLSKLSNDIKGSLDIKVNDNIFEALNFINFRFRNIYHLKLTKSLLEDDRNLKPNETPEAYSQQSIDKDLQKNTPPQLLISNSDLQNNESKNSKITIDENIKKDELKSSIETVKQQDLLEKFNDEMVKTETEYKAPVHPYIAQRYSDFYSPVYNPYFAIGNISNSYIMNTLGVQDPVIEHPH